MLSFSLPHRLVVLVLMPLVLGAGRPPEATGVLASGSPR